MKRLLLVGIFAGGCLLGVQPGSARVATARPSLSPALARAVAERAGPGDVGRDPARAPIAGGVVYIGAQDNKLYALDAVTGATLWMQTTGDQVSSSATVASGVVDVGSDDGNVYAFTLP